MDFLNIDFPETNEDYQGRAYNGYPAGWLEVFVQYAFPKGKTTETSEAMSEVFKYKPDISYEDWLDHIIGKFLNEIWFLEKLNCSRNLIYKALKSNDTISQKLRDTYYNKQNTDNIIQTSILIEETDENSEIFSSSTEYFMPEVAAKAANFSVENLKNNPKELNFWRNLRKLLWGKQGRRNQDTNKSWITRFLTFYLSYKAETAILESLENLFNTGNLKASFKFSDNTRHHWLVPDDIIHLDQQSESENVEEISTKVDILCNNNIKIECKALKANSSIHGADLVIRHTQVKDYVKKNNVISWFITGYADSITNFYKSISGETLDATQICIDNDCIFLLPKSTPLHAEFRSIPESIKAIEVSVEIEKGLAKKLNLIDQELDQISEGSEDKDIFILNTQTRNLNKALELVNPEAPMGDITSDTVDDAQDQFKISAQSLINNTNAEKA